MRTVFFTLALAAVVTAVQAQAAAGNVPTLLPPPVEAVQAANAAASGMAQNTSQNVVVPVLKQAVQKGETIVPENITMVEVPASQVFVSTLTSADALAGQQAVRPLEAGRPVNRLHVRVAPLVSRNQAVTLVYRRGGVELTGSAQALEDGAVGQNIRILNPSTRSTLNGTVQANGTVEVN